MGIQFGDLEAQENFATRRSSFLQSLEATKRLCDLVFQGSGVNTLADRTLFFLGRQVVEDFNEILLLCANSLSTGAMKILPGMFERTVTICYLVRHPSEVENLSDFRWIEEFERFDKARKYAPDLASHLRFDEVTEEFEKAKHRFQTACVHCGGLLAEYRWSPQRLDQMAEECKLQQLLSSAYYCPLEETRGTTASFKRRIKVNPDGSYRYDNGPCSELEDLTLRQAHFMLLATAETLTNHFHREELNDDLKKLFDAFVEVWGDTQAKGHSPDTDSKAGDQTHTEPPSPLLSVLSYDENNTRASIQALSQYNVFAVYERMPLIFEWLLDAVHRQYQVTGNHPLAETEDAAAQGFLLRMNMVLSASQQFVFAAGHLFRGHVSEVHPHVRRAIEGAGIAYLSKSEAEVAPIFYSGNRKKLRKQTATDRILPNNDPLTHALRQSMDMASSMLHNNALSFAARSKYSYSEDGKQWHFEGKLEYYEVNQENIQWFLNCALWMLRAAERVARLLAASFEIDDVDWREALEAFRINIDSLYVELRPILQPPHEEEENEANAASV